MAQEWYKVDNVAKVFLAPNTRRDPRVFRISCTLQEQIDPELLNEALRVTILNPPTSCPPATPRTKPPAHPCMCRSAAIG